MFGLFKRKEKTELGKATDQLLTGIDSVQAAIENRKVVFAEVNKEMQKNIDILRSIGVEV